MAFQDFLLRARRPASLVAFNGALPANFKLIVNPGGGWIERTGVNLDPIAILELVPGTLFSGIHYNLRVIGGPEVGKHAWSGWDGLFITDPSDPDFNDPMLDKSKLKRWMKNNGVEKLDIVAEHPRSGRTMRWFRWSNVTEWLDITIDEPVFRRRVWL